METLERDAVAVEEPSRWERPALISGILFVAAQIAGLTFFITFMLPKMPTVDAPASEFAAVYTQHGTIIAINNYLLALPVPFFLLFLGGLFGILRCVEGGSGALAVATAGAGIAMAMTWPFGIVLSGVGTTIATGGGDAATIHALDGMAPLSLALSAFPRTVLLGATSVVLLHSRIVPRWIGWSGLALALVSLIGTTTLLAAELFPLLALGTLLFEIWLLALTISLLRSSRAVSRPEPELVPA